MYNKSKDIIFAPIYVQERTSINVCYFSHNEDVGNIIRISFRNSNLKKIRHSIVANLHRRKTWNAVCQRKETREAPINRHIGRLISISTFMPIDSQTYFRSVFLKYCKIVFIKLSIYLTNIKWIMKNVKSIMLTRILEI